MRRDQGHSSRDPSKQLKTISKAKKTKHSNISQQERKTDLHPLKNIEVNQIKSKTQYHIKEKAISRVLEKINLMSRLVSKLVDKRQREKVTELVTLIQKEENIRNQLDSQEYEKSRHEIKQLKDSLNRLLEKQDEIVKNASYSNTLTEAMGNASGYQKTGLIGIETSPKVKHDLFAAFQKRSQQQGQLRILQDEIVKKDQVIHHLFSKLEKLSDRTTTFNQLYGSISKKVQHYQQFDEQIDRLEHSLEEQKSKIEALFDENEELKNNNNELMDEIQQAHMERDRNIKKQRQISQQFEVLVGQKLKLQYELTKKADQFCSLNQSSINRLSTIINCKTELEELVKDQLWRARSLTQKLKVDIAVYFRQTWEFSLKTVEAIIEKHQLKVDSLENQLKNKEQDIMELKRQVKEGDNHRFRLLQERQNDLKQMEALKRSKLVARSKLKINSSIIQQLLAPNEQPLQLYTFDIFQNPFNVKKFIEVQIQTQHRRLGLEQSFTFHQQGITKEFSHSEVQTIKCESPSSQICTQTFQVLTSHEYAQTEGDEKQDQHNQTQMIRLEFTSNINSQTIVFNQRQVKLTIDKALQINHHQQQKLPQNEQNGMQTEEQEFYAQFQIEDLRSIPERPLTLIEEEQSGNQILNMLQEAEDCLLIPEIQLLRRQIMAYRDEIDKLSLKIRQQQKEKEDQFNFRL